jgi:hypothetical protein
MCYVTLPDCSALVHMSTAIAAIYSKKDVDPQKAIQDRTNALVGVHTHDKTDLDTRNQGC